MDERVRVLADSMWDCADPIAVEIAEQMIAALEAAGYTVARLEQVGRGEPYDWSLGEHGDPTRQPWILSSHRTSDNAWPVYRIIDAPAVEEAEPGARGEQSDEPACPDPHDETSEVATGYLEVGGPGNFTLYRCGHERRFDSGDDYNERWVVPTPSSCGMCLGRKRVVIDHLLVDCPQCYATGSVPPAPAVEEAEPRASEFRPVTPRERELIDRIVAPAGTECPMCGGKGSIVFFDESDVGVTMPCPTCSPNETSEQ